MSTLLPMLALSLALAAALLSKQPTEESETPERGRSAASIWTLAISLILFLIAYLWMGWVSDAVHVAIGLLVGGGAAIACRWVPVPARIIASLGLAATCEGLLIWAPDEWRMLAQLGAVLGAAFGAWMLDVRSRTSVSTAVLPIALAAVVAVDILGKKVTDNFGLAGMLLAMVACAAGVLALLATMRGAKAAFQQVIAVVLLVVGGFILGWRYLESNDLWMLFLGGVIAGLVVNWLVDEDASEALRPLVAAVLWIGLATLGFGLQKGFGMSLVLLGGVSSLLLLGNRRALMSMGPVAGLVMYRVFREEHVAATRALDIGQHYALIGLAVGAVLPLMPMEWLRSRMTLTGIRMPSAGVLWMVLMASVPVVASLVLGPKGVVGFVAGLGFASLIEATRSYSTGGAERPKLQVMGLALGLSAASTIVFRFLGESATLTRDQKTGILLPLAIGIAVAVIVFLVVSPRAELKEAKAL